MNSIPGYIFFKDDRSPFIRTSRSMAKLYNANSSDELVGKSDFDFHTKQKAEKLFKEEQDIMHKQKAIEDQVALEKLNDDKEQWMSTTKMP